MGFGPRGWRGGLVLALTWACVGTWMLSANPAVAPDDSGGSRRPTRLRFEVTPSAMIAPGAAGRLLVVVAPGETPEPRSQIGELGAKAVPLLGRDFTVGAASRRPAVLDHTSAYFPHRNLGELPPGQYWVQAVWMTNRDLRLPDAPGNWISGAQRVVLNPAGGGVVRLNLDQRLPDESLPADTDLVRHFRLPSPLLSRFWGRPMFLRAGIILPRGWAEEPTRRYPVIVRIGGFGTRFTWVESAMKTGREFHDAWMAEEAPRFILVQLDGAGPLGDPYQINSANHGPFGDALLRELLPHVEAAYRGDGRPHTRVLTGGSTGGWVSLALQVMYPDQFGGCWSGYPDPTDFRALQLVDLYADTNAFVNVAGLERPCAREINGDTRFTMRHETQLENVMGDGDSYVFGGGQWGAWNATYSPRGSGGEPRAIWDPRTGAIDAEVAQAWRAYDLRLLLVERWPHVASSLRGKIRIWMGDADDYFLDTATRHLEAFLRTAEPPAEARIEFGAREPHGWEPRPWSVLLREMAEAVAAQDPRP